MEITIHSLIPTVVQRDDYDSTSYIFHGKLSTGEHAASGTIWINYTEEGDDLLLKVCDTHILMIEAWHSDYDIDIIQLKGLSGVSTAPFVVTIPQEDESAIEKYIKDHCKSLDQLTQETTARPLH